jgi:hypothetical protein
MPLAVEPIVLALHQVLFIYLYLFFNACRFMKVFYDSRGSGGCLDGRK